MKTKICNATLDDCRGIYNLTFVPGLANPEGRPPPIRWTKAFVKEKKYAFVVRESGKVAAFLLGERACGGVGLVWMLGVDKKCRGKGLGTALLKHAAKKMKADGLHVVILYGYTRNPAMKHILKKLHFHAGCTYIEYVKFLD